MIGKISWSINPLRQPRERNLIMRIVLGRPEGVR
jgi:hypothetical protein